MTEEDSGDGESLEDLSERIGRLEEALREVARPTRSSPTTS
ncbi:MAG: hypothetical protein ACLFUV_04870 [Methanomassiliicoccales archaeon]